MKSPLLLLSLALVGTLARPAAAGDALTIADVGTASLTLVSGARRWPVAALRGVKITAARIENGEARLDWTSDAGSGTVAARAGQSALSIRPTAAPTDMQASIMGDAGEDTLWDRDAPGILILGDGDIAGAPAAVVAASAGAELLRAVWRGELPTGTLELRVYAVGPELHVTRRLAGRRLLAQESYSEHPEKREGRLSGYRLTIDDLTLAVTRFDDQAGTATGTVSKGGQSSSITLRRAPR